MWPPTGPSSFWQCHCSFWCCCCCCCCCSGCHSDSSKLELTVHERNSPRELSSMGYIPTGKISGLMQSDQIMRAKTPKLFHQNSQKCTAVNHFTSFLSTLRFYCLSAGKWPNSNFLWNDDFEKLIGGEQMSYFIQGVPHFSLCQTSIIYESSQFFAVLSLFHVLPVAFISSCENQDWNT